MLPTAIWIGSGKDIKNACTLTQMCNLESSFKVQHWFPEVRPNMDALGTHNNVLCLELYREGLITDSKDWHKSIQWPLWRKFFQQRPDIGTMIACRAFVRLADRFGLDNAVMMWKTGRTNTIPGLLYLNSVRCGRDEMMKLYRRAS